MSRDIYPRIIGTRPAAETCSSYLTNGRWPNILDFFQLVIRSTLYRVIEPGEDVQVGDMVFYSAPFRQDAVSHVARVEITRESSSGSRVVVSKFRGDENVYLHEVTGQPIRRNDPHSRSQIYVRKNFSLRSR